LPTRAGSPKASDPERLGDCFRTGDSRRLKPCFAGAAGVVCRWSGKRSLALGVDLWDKEKEKGAREKASPQPLPPLFLNGTVNTQNKIVDANFRVAFLLSYALLTLFPLRQFSVYVEDVGSHNNLFPFKLFSCNLGSSFFSKLYCVINLKLFVRLTGRSERSPFVLRAANHRSGNYMMRLLILSP